MRGLNNGGVERSIMNEQRLLLEMPLEAFLSWNGQGSLWAHLENWRRRDFRRWKNWALMMPPDVNEYKGPRRAA